MVKSNCVVGVNFASPQVQRDAVVIVGDKKYSEYGLFLAQQLKTIERDRQFDICVLSTENFNPPSILLDSVRLGQVAFSAEQVAQVRTDSRIGFESYLRIFLPFVMSEYRRILYLDADIIQCRAGAQRLLDLEMDGKPIAAARDGNYWGVLDIRRTQKRYLRRVGQSKENYVNAGVLLIDTQKYVKFLDENNILNELVSCAGILKVHDQSYLNMKFKDQIQLISPSWNFPMADEFVGSLHIADPVFLHFVGKTKPWLSTDHPVRREYFETFTRFLEEYFQTSEFSAAPEPRHSEKASRKYNNPLREWIAWRMSKSRFDRAYHRAPDIVRSLVDRFRYQFEDEA
jgi:lipopolysaccharide biosynthesis glycosyltransferase